MVSGLVKEDQDDAEELFEYLYKNAQINLKIDTQKKLANRFHIDKKLITRETSEFKPDLNEGSELAGVKISVTLPKYARVHILSIGVKSFEASPSPGGEFFIYKKDADGELLSTIEADLEEGRNTIDVYQEFEEEDLFIAYNPGDLSLYQTKNRYYDDLSPVRGLSQDIACSFPCYFNGSEGSVRQVNGGGLNVKFIVYCSMDKFLCENLPLFKFALWNRLGVEVMKERLTSDLVNRFTVITNDEAEKLMPMVNEDYQAALDAATMNIKMNEDPICFMCKSTISKKTNLP